MKNRKRRQVYKWKGIEYTRRAGPQKKRWLDTI